jgi:MATE family multidrug resistance protein
MELRATIWLALPLVAAQLGQIAIHTTDVVMIGWLGPNALAAGVLGHQVYFVSLLFCMGILLTIAPLVAQALGADDADRVRQTVRQGLWVAIALTLSGSGFLWHTGSLLSWLGQTPDHAASAEHYVRAAMWGFGPTLGFTVLRGFTSALSRPRSILLITLGGVGFNNTLSNYALMFGHLGCPRLELVGAGLSSSLVQTAMFGVLLAHTLWDTQYRRFRLLHRLWEPCWPRFRDICRIGLPIGAALLAESGLFATATLFMGWVGAAALAAHAVALQCAGVAFMVPLGIGQAGTVRVGLAVGQQDADGIRRAGWTALILGASFMSSTAVLFLLAPRTLIGFFLDLRDPQAASVVGLAVSYLTIAACFQLVDGLQVVASSVLRGLNDTRAPFVIALTGYWGGGFMTAYVLAFPLGMGGVGVWYGLAVGLAIVACLLVWRFHQRERFELLCTAKALSNPPKNE